MTSGAIRIERMYPAGHRNRHTPHLCRECGGPLTFDGRCTHCDRAVLTRTHERPVLRFPDRRSQLERMERVAAH